MIGSVISNRYELLENIGAGGMAIVYKAKCRLLNRNVAVKILRPEFQEDEEFLKRFNIEAQAAASLSHPNVVSVYDVGKHGKLNYIVMECIEGITLKEYMARKGTLSVNEATDFTLQIASALEHAHAKGIIHRDIKPHNIIITNDGVLKVTDFGLARAVSSSTTVAGSSTAIGSVHYASPEQARGGFTDERSDIYSLGVVMYEMFTGTLPFDGDTPVAVAMKHLQDAPKLPSERNPNVPPDIERIILKAMQKDVKERYASVTDLITDIKHLSETPAVPHTDKFSTQKLPKIPEPQPAPEEPKPVPKKKRKKEDTVAIIAAVATAIVIIAVLGVLAAKLLFPSGKVAGGADITVPSLVNTPLEEAKEKYKDINIEEQGSTYSSTIPEGNIATQDKEAGTKMKATDKITITVSRGAQKIELDNYTGEDYRKAERALKELGLVAQISEEFSDDAEAGEIIRQNPNAGYQMRTGDTVVLYVSKGKNTVEVAMPSLVGKTEAEARELLKSSDLNIGTVDAEYSSIEKGTVTKQAVDSGTMVSSGTAINFTVSNGLSETPAPTGSYALRLDLPQNKDMVYIKVVHGAKVYFEGSFSTEPGTATVNLSGSKGDTTVDVYFDDTLYRSGVPIKFE